MHAQAEHGQHCCDDTVLMTKGESDNSSTGGNPGKVILRHGRQECLQIQPRGAPEGKQYIRVLLEWERDDRRWKRLKKNGRPDMWSQLSVSWLHMNNEHMNNDIHYFELPYNSIWPIVKSTDVKSDCLHTWHLYLSFLITFHLNFDINNMKSWVMVLTKFRFSA